PGSGEHTPTMLLGNQSVHRRLANFAIQTKLTVGAPDDEYEKEADAVAERVMSFRDPQAAGASDQDRDEHSKLRSKRAGSSLNRQAMLGRIPIRTLQKTLGNRALARLLDEQTQVLPPPVPELRRKCACGGESEEECSECRASRMALQRKAE